MLLLRALFANMFKVRVQQNNYIILCRKKQVPIEKYRGFFVINETDKLSPHKLVQGDISEFTYKR